MNEKFLVSEFAAIKGCSAPTVRKAINKGALHTDSEPFVDCAGNSRTRAVILNDRCAVNWQPGKVGYSMCANDSLFAKTLRDKTWRW